MQCMGESQHLEQPNVERPIIRNFEIPNPKKTRDRLFDFFIFKFIFYFYICLKIIWRIKI